MTVRSPALPCSPKGAHAGGASAVQCCYELEAPNPEPTLTAHVSDAFGALALGVEVPQLPCQPCALVP